MQAGVQALGHVVKILLFAGFGFASAWRLWQVGVAGYGRREAPQPELLHESILEREMRPLDAERAF